MSGGPKLPGQWVAIDVNFLASPLAIKLLDRFGPAGPLAWIGLLCACKRSPTPGVMTFSSEAEALAMLGLTGIPLVDNAGEKWDLETLWTVLGQLKQTKRTMRGRLLNVRATHWEQWQDDERREDERERQRRLRAKTARDTPVTPSVRANKNVTPESESESESDNSPPKPPPRGANRNASLNDETTTAAADEPASLTGMAEALKVAMPAEPKPAGRHGRNGTRTETAEEVEPT